MKRAFTKPATTYTEQVALLQQRGMGIADESKAAFYLQHLNYYRLAAYWLPFEADHASHTFIPGTRFDDVLNLYIFDRELRLLVLDAIERLEVSVRSQWAYQMAHRHGSHAHLQPLLARDWANWVGDSNQLVAEVKRSKENFIEHLTQTYSDALPPVWAVCEIMSLGLLSRQYKNLKEIATRTAIAGQYGIDQQVFESWLHHLTFIRNICAHHNRLWNREFTITPQHPRSKPRVLRGEFVASSRKLYNTLVIITHFMETIAPAHRWRQRLKKLIAEHGIPVQAMDFPEDWTDRPIWLESAP
ncbi:MAG: Abi family protein [Betaproteobacteria bacterium]|nr:Abi family protein [Betaproteobacteria bacterium]